MTDRGDLIEKTATILGYKLRIDSENGHYRTILDPQGNEVATGGDLLTLRHLLVLTHMKKHFNINLVEGTARLLGGKLEE